jgi:hypothetical protein
METLKERTLKEQLNRLFGNRESAAEIKQAVLLSQTGKISDDAIEQYRKQKEAEGEEIRKQFTQLNPSYAFDYPKETEAIILSKDSVKEC